ncbi:MAG: DUF2953 domain-containing protein [Ruminococcaceae bacterium]|nr:DUF2953 domain-containing protein [Oscillospiraceae bacterium]
MWAVYSLLALLALVLAVLLIPVFGRVAYDGAFSARIRVLGIPITLYPAPEKPPKKRKKKAKAVKKTVKKQQKQSKMSSKWQEIVALFKEDGVASTLRFLVEVAGLAGRTAGKVLRAITVKNLRLELLIAGEDAATTAQRYGQVCSVVYPALSLIECKVRVRHRQVRVEPNFLLEQGGVRFDVRFRVSVWRLLGAGISLLWGFLMLRMKDIPEKSKEVM